MQPFYFGASGTPLFGVYHPPQGRTPRAGAVVLCPPFGLEYLRAHRALRELANQLAEHGSHVLRFDYYACGDSGGQSEEADVDQWAGDIATAIDELKETSGASTVSLVGIRLGAALAALVASGRADVEAVVLWDPVVSGKLYLEELVCRHRILVSERPRPAGFVIHNPPDELLGSPITEKLRKQFEALDLMGLTRKPAGRVLLLSSDGSKLVASLKEHLVGLSSTAAYEHLPGAKVWVKEKELDQTLVPQSTLSTIGTWLSHFPNV